MPFEAETQQQEKKVFNCSYLDEISFQGLFLRSVVPVFQKRIASNYVTIKKIFSYTVVQPKVTNAEYVKMRELGFGFLEATSDERAYKELKIILDWANSPDTTLNDVADFIFQVRIKELKYLLAYTSPAKMSEFEAGYRIYDKYLEFIAG